MDSKGTILIIDDEEGIRKGCTRVLQPAGYTVEVATGFRDGLKKIQASNFELVLLDVMMPDGKGIDLLEPIRLQDPEAVIVLITGYATVELAVDAIKRGAYDFISKPFSGQLLLMTVEQGLEKRRLSAQAAQLKTVQQQLDETEQARIQMERLSEFKSTFATMVAHELRSPIGASQTLVRTVLRGLAGELNPRQKELLGRVEIRLDSLLTLVNDLLTLAASKSLEAEKPLQPLDIQPVLERVVQAYKDDADAKHITLTCNSICDAQIQATEDGLQTVLANLIGNAIKYTPPEGSVQVEMEMEPDCARLRVTDTGIGIADQDLPRVGEEFFRGANARGQNIVGTGLGMSIVKELVHKFGAEIVIASQDGRGTAVTLEFPLLTEPTEIQP